MADVDVDDDHPITTPREALIDLLTTYHDLNNSTVEVADDDGLSTLNLLRCINRNQPTIFRGAALEMASVEKWNLEYLRNAMEQGKRKIVVAETPLGNADSAVVNKEDGKTYFVKPHLRDMEFGEFVDGLRKPEGDGGDGIVRYSQSQDNNITSDYLPLSSDVSSLSWASEAFGAQPDAINVWIGNSRSVSAMHKDPYENLYCQVLGRKTFVLISPLESVCVGEATLPAATYAVDGSIIPDNPPAEVPCWPTVDPDLGPDKENVWWKHCRPMKAELERGDILYLPAMWYHKVSQVSDPKEGICCALNYWYDMEYSGVFWPAINFVRNIAALESKAKTEVGETG